MATALSGHVTPRKAGDELHPTRVNVIQVIDYHKTYGETVAVRGLSFQVPARAILGLVGANGAGKTTTLRALAGIIPPTQGQLLIAGHDVVREPVAAKSRLAYVPDDPKLFDELTVWEHTVVMVAPIIPAVNDAEIEAILKTAQTAGAREAGYVMLRLPLEVRDVFKDWLDSAMPERARKVMSLVKSVRDGKENDAAFGRRMTGTGPYAWTIGRRFELACQRLGLNLTRVKLATGHFRRPPQPGEQLTLL